MRGTSRARVACTRVTSLGVCRMVRRLHAIVASSLVLVAVATVTVWHADGAMQGGGLGHTVIATSAGSVFTFGLNNNGQIGDNTLRSGLQDHRCRSECNRQS